MSYESNEAWDQVIIGGFFFFFLPLSFALELI